MSQSPRKHRGPLRPMNTLSSPQKPSFQTPSGRKAQPEDSVLDSDDYSSFLSDTHLSDTDIGNSSSLFEQTPLRDPASPSPSPFASPARPSNNYADRVMARDREPPAASAPRAEAPLRAEAPRLPKPQDRAAPEFGKASPLRNPLKNPAPKDPYAHLFVPKPSQPSAPRNLSNERPPSNAASSQQSRAQTQDFGASVRPGQSHPLNQSVRPGQGHPLGQSTRPRDSHSLNQSVRPGQQNPLNQSVRPGQGHPFNQSTRGGQSHPFSQSTRGQGHPFNQSTRGQGHPFNQSTRGQGHPFKQSTRGQPHPFNQSTRGGRPGTADSNDSDLFEIDAAQFQPKQSSYQGVTVPKPKAGPPRTIPPTPRPLFSSIGPGTGFDPRTLTAENPGFTTVNSGFNPLNPHGARQTVILDDDEFDPDAVIRAEGHRFGAPDPYAYVDTAKAEENLKQLLEGAFEGDDEKIPRTRGRKKKQQKAVDDAAKSLAEKLAALDVKDEPEKEEEEDEEEEEDDGSVEGMKVKLLPHQVDGVAWMVEKETGAHMKKIPPKGGILADDMGLGKTVQSIALILSNPRPEKDADMENKKNKIAPTVGKGTLIVAPLALIKQWEAEIKDKVTSSHSLKVLVHHGQNRTKSAEKLKSYDVVVTTFQILSSEHAGGDGLNKGVFGVHWYRVILDEAHTIKNRNAKMTKACYDIRSHYRWCLTGTPMQNNLDELQSLIKFLQIKPYCEMAAWKDQISQPMKNGRGNLAMRRLQIFLKACMKRRTKEVLKKEGALNFGGKAKDGEKKGGFQIVARNVENIIGSFTAEERRFYDRLSNRAETRLAEMMGGEKTDYIGALVLLLRLRQACNHPKLTKSNVKDDKDALTTGSKPQTGTMTPRKSKDTDADDLADLLGGLSVATKRCDICQVHLNRDNAATGAIRCHECEDDLTASTKKVKKVKKAKKEKKHRKHKHREHKKKHRATQGDEDDDDDEGVQAPQPSRQRRLVADSDDEDEEGEWIVGEDKRDVPDLGKAGGTDDENAEGEADTLDSIDSVSFATEVDANGSPVRKGEMDSFISHDTDSENEAPVVRKRLFQKKKVIDLISDSEAASASGSETDGYDSESSSEDEDDESELDSEPEYRASDLTPSTKIRQLLSILEKETPDHKVIVFSQFTSMLDLIEPFLKRHSYNFTRYDGGMRNDLREASLHKLRNDKRTRVLLCSLKCGSLGLNLTAASRVVIMEPFWNPFVEEQAIDRVHRLNQTVDVTVYRLSIHNSVEERIIELQEAKRKLATAALEGGKAMGKLSMKDMLALFKRDAEFDHRHVDDEGDQAMFSRMKVLDGGRDGGYVDEGESVKPRRKAGSLGLGKSSGDRKKEDSVWGRR